jgi:hypothetical protein
VFRPGDAVLFRSTEGGGCWKPGVVESMVRAGGNGPRPPRMVRIETGVGVWVIRPLACCRRRRKEAV